jgi:hypothetical protein
MRSGRTVTTPATRLLAVVGVLLVIAALVRASASRVTWILFKSRLSKVLAVLLVLLVLWVIGSHR